MQFLPLIIIFLFTGLFAQEQKSEADARKELLGTVRVSTVHSMDEVKGAYKSPRRAMFMSLLLPGSGQMYVGSKQSCYIRGVFYMAEEVALISGMYYYSIYKYDKKVKGYQSFAKSHFSVGKYESEMNNLYEEDPDYKNSFEKLYGTERDSYCKAFYGSYASAQCVSDFGKNVNNNPGDNTPIYNSSEFYRIIAGRNFIPGWDDATSNAEEIKATLLASEDYSEYMQLGESKNYKEYLSKRKKANSLADKQIIYLGAIILNHIVSAVDAALSARAHNESLYEEKISFLNKLRLGSDFQMGENFKAGAGLWYSF